MDKLKPCPFCGAIPVIKERSLDERFGYATKCMVYCTKCGTSKGAQGDTSKGGYADNRGVEEKAVKAWNTRAADTALAEAEARIKELDLKLAQADYNYDADRQLFKSRIADLEKALEPFAREGSQWGNVGSHKQVATHVDNGDSSHSVELLHFTGDDLRRAAALLKEKE